LSKEEKKKGVLLNKKMYLCCKLIDTNMNTKLIQHLNLQVRQEVLRHNVELWEENSEDTILENIKQGLREIKLINQGKLKARPAHEIMKELNEL
jgi:hypothetical protein